MSPRKSVPQELTREMILEAASDLFAVNGYQHVSMRQIASKLGYSHGAIYYHFKNKAELFYALVSDQFHLLDRELEQIMKKNLDDKAKLKQLFLGYIRFGLTYQSHYETMFLVKNEEVKNFLNMEPNHTYQNFAQNVYSLCGKNVSLQEIWSVFLSLHGFVTHYCHQVDGYEEVEGLAQLHANFLLKAII